MDGEEVATKDVGSIIGVILNFCLSKQSQIEYGCYTCLSMKEKLFESPHQSPTCISRNCFPGFRSGSF